MSRSTYRTNSGGWWDGVRTSLDDLAGFWLFEAVTGRDRGNWDHMAETSRLSWTQRAAGQRDFIPSPEHHNEEVVHAVVLPMPDVEIPAKVISIDDPLFKQWIPSTAKQLAKKLQANGWHWSLTYCMGPWPKKTETVKLTEENEDGELIETGVEEKVKYDQAESYVVRFRRGELRGWAMWLYRPWLKDAKVAFYTAHVLPYHGKINSKELALIIASKDGFHTTTEE